ncbi:hypothetical protein CEXT_398871 [Caerostris extrusa]|uniref:Uncharacterized protein n=1 Tax=Caerostris extrusa TaxID=172846 RepID=A0AAV4TRC4_CAEEX|nr:hypothetical protein CEXT_398871 [Caerostris extrusa]
MRFPLRRRRASTPPRTREAAVRYATKRQSAQPMSPFRTLKLPDIPETTKYINFRNKIWKRTTARLNQLLVTFRQDLRLLSCMFNIKHFITCYFCLLQILPILLHALRESAV